MFVCNASLTVMFKRFANLKFAINLLFFLGILITIGTFVKQDQSVFFYMSNYPNYKSILRSFDWRWVYFFGFNKVYTSYYFSVILFSFGSSLIACTFTTQLPIFKSFRVWKFRNSSKRFLKLKTINLLKTSSNSLTLKLHRQTHHLFCQNARIYAYSGSIGRIGPIFVHLSMLSLIISYVWSVLNGYLVQELTPRGEIIHFQNLLKSGKISYLPQIFSCRVNDFWITYKTDFKTNQFYSSLSLLDDSGFEIQRKTIFINEPYLYKGITLYQKNWDILGLKTYIKANEAIKIPVKKINTKSKKIWVGGLAVTLETGKIINYNILINNLFGNLSVYDATGKLIGKYVIGEKFTLNINTSVQFFEFLTKTGLEIKTDSGIPVLYFSFYLLGVSIYISFISYSQIWQFETSKKVIICETSKHSSIFSTY